MDELPAGPAIVRVPAAPRRGETSTINEPKLVLKVINPYQDFPEDVYFKVHANSTLKTLMEKYVIRLNDSLDDFMHFEFYFNFSKLNYTDTPAQKGMKDFDIIYAADDKDFAGSQHTKWWGEKIKTSYSTSPVFNTARILSLPRSVPQLADRMKVKIVLEKDIGAWTGFGLVDLDHVKTYAVPKSYTLNDLIKVVNNSEIRSSTNECYHMFRWEKFENQSSKPTQVLGPSRLSTPLADLEDSELLALLSFRELSGKVLQGEQRETITVFLKLYDKLDHALTILPFLFGTYSLDDQLSQIIVEKEFSAFYNTWSLSRYVTQYLREHLEIYKEAYPFPTIAEKLDINATFRECKLRNFDVLILSPAYAHPSDPAAAIPRQVLSVPELYWSKYATSVDVTIRNMDPPYEFLCRMEVSRNMAYPAFMMQLCRELTTIGLLPLTEEGFPKNLRETGMIKFYQQREDGLPETHSAPLRKLITVAELLHPERKRVDTLFIRLTKNINKEAIRKIQEDDTYPLKVQGLFEMLQPLHLEFQDSVTELHVCDNILGTLGEVNVLKAEFNNSDPALAAISENSDTKSEKAKGKEKKKNKKKMMMRREVNEELHGEKEKEVERKVLSNKQGMPPTENIEDVIERLSREALLQLVNSGDVINSKDEDNALPSEAGDSLSSQNLDNLVVDCLRRAIIAKQEHTSDPDDDEEAKEMLYYWLKEEKTMLENFNNAQPLEKEGQEGTFDNEEEEEEEGIDKVIIEKTKEEIAEEMSQLFLLHGEELEKGKLEFVNWMNEHHFSLEEQKELIEMVEQYLLDSKKLDGQTQQKKEGQPTPQKSEPKQQPFSFPPALPSIFLPSAQQRLQLQQLQQPQRENQGQETTVKPEENDGGSKDTAHTIDHKVEEKEKDDGYQDSPIKHQDLEESKEEEGPTTEVKSKKEQIEEEVEALRKLVEEKDIQVTKLKKRVKTSEENMTSHIELFQKKMDEMEEKVNESRFLVDDVTYKLLEQTSKTNELKRRVAHLKGMKKEFMATTQKKKNRIVAFKKQQGEQAKELEKEREKAHKSEAKVKELTKRLQKAQQQKRDAGKKEAETSGEREKFFEAKYRQEAEEKIKEVNSEWKAKLKKLEEECAVVKREKEKVQGVLKKKEVLNKKLKDKLDKVNSDRQHSEESDKKLRILMGHEETIMSCSLAELKEWEKILEVSFRKVGEAKIKAEVAQHLADTEKKKQEQERMKKECVICCEHLKNIVFVPCGHHVCCQSCSDKLVKCPMCRQAITQRVLLYDS